MMRNIMKTCNKRAGSIDLISKRNISIQKLQDLQKCGATSYGIHPLPSSMASHASPVLGTAPLFGIYNKDAIDYELDASKAADHTGRQQNHIWNKEEINHRFDSLYRHEPKTISDKLMNFLVRYSFTL